MFLLANDDELLRRFAETRRKHPISTDHVSLKEAIAIERRLLEPILNAADLVIDTSRMGVHDLRELISQRVEKRSAARLSLLVESFGFKNGIPGDADFVFDARSLPNPYWDPALRALTGRDPDVIRFLEAQRTRAAAARRHPAVRGGAHSRAPGRESPLPHHRHRLHRRPSSLGVSGGARRRAARAEPIPVVALRHNSLGEMRSITRAPTLAGAQLRRSRISSGAARHYRKTPLECDGVRREF